MIVDLSDKVVIVTGAASGIGAAIAQCAADSDVGALVLTDRDPDGCARVRVNGINLGWVATEGEHHM